MYDPKILAFIKVAETGSTSKAAKELFLSTNAVNHQIHSLEKKWNTILFQRSAKGMQLTKQGKYMYEKALLFIQYSNEIFQTIPSDSYETDIQITRYMTRTKDNLSSICSSFANENPRYNIQLFPYFDHTKLVPDLEEQLLVNDIFISPRLNQTAFLFKQLYEKVFYCAVPKNHPLASRTSLTVADLKDEKIGIIKPGISPDTDDLRKELNTDNIINITNINDFSRKEYICIVLDTYNSQASFKVTVPLNSKVKVKFGMYYSPYTLKDLNPFIQFIKNHYKVLK